MSTLENKPFHLEGDPDKDHACLLLHGLGGGTYEFQPVAQALNSQGYGVEGIIYPGHEQNSAEMPDSHWQDWYQHVLETYYELREEYSKISLIGFSTGCPLSLKLALEEKVEKLILLSPFLKLLYKWTHVIPLEWQFKLFAPFVPLIRQVPRRLTKLYDSEMVSKVREIVNFKTFNLKAVESAIELIEQIKPLLHQITQPALIIQSRRDNIVCPSGAEYLAERLSSEEKELVWLDNSYHTVTLDQEREEVNQKVIEFLKK